MKNLNDIVAQNCAVEYIKRTRKIETSSGGFNSYFVRVGEDLNHTPDTIFVEDLPALDLEIMTNTNAKKIFYDNCDANSEYLVRVAFNVITKELKPEIMIKPFSSR